MTNYQINKGDTLSGIASKSRTTVAELLKKNPTIKDPNRIYAGSSLVLPDTSPIAPESSRTSVPGAPIVSPIQRSNLTPGTTPGTTPLSSALADRVQKPNTRSTLLDSLTKALSGASGFDEASRRKQLESERGVTELRTAAGSFSEEVARTNKLIDTIEEDINTRTDPFLVSESQRRRILASEATPLLKSLGIAERGFSSATERLGLEREDIASVLESERATAERPLDMLMKELGVRSDIKTLTQEEQTAERESAIADLYGQGITDPLKIYDLLNFDEEGNRIGDITISDVNTFLDSASGNKAKKAELEIKKLEAELANETDPLNRQLKQAQIAQAWATVAKTKAEAAPSGSPIKVGGADFTPDTKLTADEEKKVQQYEAGILLVDQIEKLYNEMVGDEGLTLDLPIIGGIQQRLKGRGVPLIEGLSFGLIDTPTLSGSAQIYKDFLDSNRAPIAKGLKGEVGNLTENEQKNALKSFPDIFDRPSVARAKFEEIRKQITNGMSTLGNFSGTPSFGTQSIDDDFEKYVDE